MRASKVLIVENEIEDGLSPWRCVTGRLLSREGKIGWPNVIRVADRRDVRNIERVRRSTSLQRGTAGEMRGARWAPMARPRGDGSAVPICCTIRVIGPTAW